jgi:bifunctional UDP-N-acetylglucosamine pyrophosphorylase/glucosamine-1-phosphate N-acetyltransferase
LAGIKEDIMQAIILAAGASTRFYPLSETKPKAMVTLLGKPLLEHTLLGLNKLGIKKVILVVSKDSLIKDYFGRGERLGMDLYYITQAEPLGMGHALLSAKSLIKEDFFVLHGHHFDVVDYVLPMVEKKRSADGVLLGQNWEEVWDFGVVKIEGDKVLSITEKPVRGKEVSKIRIVGIYLLPAEFIPYLEKERTKKHQFEAALDTFAQNKSLRIFIANKEPISLKYPWDLLAVKNWLLERSVHQISRGAKIGKGVIMVGKMVIEEGAVIFENATIKGPVFIGKNVLVGNNALIREGACLEERVRIGAFSEVKNSIFLPHSSLGSGFVASSIIGEYSRLAHGFTSANRRFDRKTIKVKIKGEEIDSGLDDLGVMMAEEVNTGIQVGTMPGVTIGKGATIGPGSFVFEDIAPGINYKTEFKSVKKRT